MLPVGGRGTCRSTSVTGDRRARPGLARLPACSAPSFLLYPNAEAIHDEALRLALARGLPVVLTCSAAPFLDADGAEAVRDLTAACGAAGLPVVFAEAANSVLDKMKAAGVAFTASRFRPWLAPTPSRNGSRPRPRRLPDKPPYRSAFIESSNDFLF